MGLFSRISGVLRANINEIISRAEDPEKMLNTAIEEMQKQLIEAKSRVAMAIADEKRLLKKFELDRERAAEWEKKAMSAVRAKRDDLAVEALARKKEHQAAAHVYEEQLGSQRGAVDDLKRALYTLTSKLEETKRTRTILMARAKRAEAQRHIATTLHAASDSSAADRLERLEARVERAEAEAEANWEVAAITEGDLDRGLSDEIALLEAPALDDDLLALKDRMRDEGMLTTGSEVPMALPSGDPDPGSDITDPSAADDEDDLEALASSLPPVEDEPSDDLADAKRGLTH